MENYQCHICEKSFNNPRGLRSHMNWHDAEYLEKQAVPKSTINRSKISEQFRNNNIELYNLQKKKCLGCDIELEYDQRNRSFCSYTCSAIQRNKDRSIESRQKQRNSIISHYNQLSYEYTKVSYIICKICNKEYYVKGNRKTCSDKCLSELRAENNKNRESHPNSGGFRHVSILYKGYYLDSNYELRLAKDLDQNNVIWIRPKFFYYIDFENKKRRYTPDFYLPEYDIYIDTKNDYLISIQQDKLERARTQNNIVLIIADKNHLTWKGILDILSMVDHDGNSPP